MTEIKESLSNFQDELLTARSQFSQFNYRIDDMEASIVERINLISEILTGTTLQSVLTPGQLYRIAYMDFVSGRYEQAKNGFKRLYERYPGAEFVPQALFYSGECEFNLKNYEDAIKSYDEVLKNYPLSQIVPSSYLKKAVALKMLGKLEESKSIFELIVKKYPAREEAQAARNYLEEFK